MSLMTLFAGSATSGSFLPTSLSGLQLWLDASDSASITLDGSNNVSQWNDKSGNAFHATMATLTKRPAYSTAAINGLNVCTFDGVDDVMAGAILFAADSSVTFFAVAKKLAASSAAGTSYFHLGTDKFFGLSLGSTGANNNKGAYLNGGVAWRIEAAADIANGTLVRQTLARTSGGTTNYSRKGGFTISNTDAPGATPYGVYNVGSQTTAGSSYQNLQFCEGIVYNRLLTGGEITAVETYLDGKWGVP